MVTTSSCTGARAVIRWKAVFSIVALAIAYSGWVASMVWCTGIVPHQPRCCPASGVDIGSPRLPDLPLADGAPSALT
ncbi:hypothetical protein Misp01_34540 [Microtetraspora sp. NBRC 13810]|nr:hypothetical protein Misp01_34540 [Microtetraspora sp. NBRC 13810]